MAFKPVLAFVLAHLAVDLAQGARERQLWDQGWHFYRGRCPSQAVAQSSSSPARPAGAPPACAVAGYDDSTWRHVALPHDWGREDLPGRVDDHEYPVIGARYGPWKLHAGDNASWAAPGFDDSGWAAAAGGMDWREYGHAFESLNQSGWYRQTLPPEAVPPFMVNSSVPVTLSLGIIAGVDQTYLNGQLIGATPAASRHTKGGRMLGVRAYVTTRAYALPRGLLHPRGGAPNVLAVRVLSYGGAGRGPANASNYTDSASFPPYGTSFPGGFYDDPHLLGTGEQRRQDERVGMFDAAVSPGTMGTAYSLGGTGWYRKTFALPGPRPAGRKVFLMFEGVYMNSSVWLNGVLLGTRPYGYTTFQYDLTPHLNKQTATNVVAVRVLNLGRNSRYYSGSGIYRHVWLTCTDAVHVPLWGAILSTPAAHMRLSGLHTASEALVQARVTVANTAPQAVAEAVVAVSILRPDGSVAGRATTTTQPIAGGASTSVTLQVLMTGDVALWGTHSPSMHTAHVSVAVAQPATVSEHDGSVLALALASSDAVDVPFGVRAISFNSSSGFVINGVPTKLYGGCVHHDNGPLGALAIDRAEERKVLLLKSHGYNAVRTSHNPVSPAFLDACDRHGMLVMNEAFDCWGQGKNPQDYHLYFAEWWRRDLGDLVRRDRNHPSVVLWSIGNEIPMRFSRQGANLSAAMTDIVHALDAGSGRAVTAAYPLINEQDSAFLHNLDVAGYNYAGPGIYAEDHKRLPNRTMVGTESFAQASFNMWSDVWNMNSVVGDFIWTAVDYVGDDYVGSESGDVDYLAGIDKHPWPWHISYCGDFDIVGHAKPQSVYRRVLWGVAGPTGIMGMLVHGPTQHPELPVSWTPSTFNWNWPHELESWSWPGSEGRMLGVRVFARGCESARLTLDGRSLGTARVQPNLTAIFTVAYAPGRLEALCVNGSTIVPNISAALRTAGSPAALVLSADRLHLAHTPNDLSYVTVTVVDGVGVRCPTAAVRVTFKVSGGSGAVSDGARGPNTHINTAPASAQVLAVGSGDPSDPGSFTASTRVTWRGRALAVLQPTVGPGSAPGTTTLTAAAPGLTGAQLTITTAL